MNIDKQAILRLKSSGLSSRKIAEQLGCSKTYVNNIVNENREIGVVTYYDDVPRQIEKNLLNGRVLFVTDPHMRPFDNVGELSKSARGSIKIAKDLQPSIIVVGGDLFDFSCISKHDPIGWNKQLTVAQELEAGIKFLNMLSNASPNSKLVFISGNHDERFSKDLAKHVPQMRGVKGMDIRDHIPKNWEYVTSMKLNNNTVFLHGWHGGVNHVYNNVLKSGMNIISGHTHSLQITPYTDFAGTRFGVSGGTLAAIKDNPLFAYTNSTPTNWIEGFVVLTYLNGVLQYPEVAYVNANNRLIFRGQVVC